MVSSVVKQGKLIIIVILLIGVCFSIAGAETENTESLKHLKEKALAGDAHAQYLMGFHALQETSGRQDLTRAEHWFRLSARQNYAKGMYGLGFVLDHKPKNQEERTEAARLFRLSADRGVVPAQYSLALYILEGKGGLSRDVNTATTLLQKAALQGYLPAHLSLVKMAHKKLCSADIGTTSFQWIENKAKKSNTNAQYTMGEIYRHGYGVPEDFDRAASWYEMAAAKGYGMAHLRLGGLYESDSGSDRNYEKARQAYETAAQMGIDEAKWNLGRMYEHGIGIRRNEKKALEYYLPAARNGHLKSMTAYGIFLAQGRGEVEQNDSAAAAWLGKAAAWGDANAQYYLGKMYLEDRIPVVPTEKDRFEKGLKVAMGKYWSPVKLRHRMALSWFKKAASQGHEKAISELERESTLKGRMMLGTGIIILPLAGRGFFDKRFMARYVGAPLGLLMGIVMIVEGWRTLGL